MSKKLILIGAVLMCYCMAISSCSKVKDALSQSFTWTPNDDTLYVPPIADTLLYTSMGSVTVTYDLDSIVKSKTSNALGLKNIESFKIKSVTLTMLNPDSANNFANFEKVKVSFFTATSTTPVVICEVDNNPSTYATVLNIPIANPVDLKSYLPSSGTVTMSCMFSGKLRHATTKTCSYHFHRDTDAKGRPQS